MNPEMKKMKNYSRSYYCVYCDKPQAKLLRHLETVHKYEPEVLKLRESKADEKKALLNKLKNSGLKKLNLIVNKEGAGSFLVKYRPRAQKRSAPVEPNDFL